MTNKNVRDARFSDEMMHLMSLYCQKETQDDKNDMTCKKISNIAKMLHDSIMHCVNYKIKNRKISVDKIIETEKEDKDAKTNRESFRFSDNEITLLKQYYKTSNVSFAIRCAVRDITTNNIRPPKIDNSEKITYLTGQKNAEMIAFLNDAFNSVNVAHNINYYIEPFTGTANVALHMALNVTTKLNDIDTLRYNLLLMIQKHPFELKIEILSHKPSKEYFNQCIKELKKIKLNNKKNRISAGAMYYLICNCSVFGKGETYKEITWNNYQKRTDSISVIHDKLKNAQITNADALYLLDKNKYIKDALIYLDPPYIFSEDYYNTQTSNEKVFKSHTALRNRICKLARNNICFVSYRMTTSKTMQNKGHTDEMLQQRLDQLYLNQGFHIAFKQLKNTKGQIEILICTVPFGGSKPYNQPLSCYMA